jgi:hypothetical protein
MAFEIPDSTRLKLLAIAREAIGELLKDESIAHDTWDQIESAHVQLIAAYGNLERWQEVIA